MPASDSFPRGQSFAALSAGGAASITIPASPGIVHILDSFTAVIWNNAAVAFGPNITCDGHVIGSVLIPAIINSKDTEGGDVQITGTRGQSMVVAFSLGTASVFELLRIKWHDI